MFLCSPDNELQNKAEYSAPAMTVRGPLTEEAWQTDLQTDLRADTPSYKEATSHLSTGYPELGATSESRLFERRDERMQMDL